MKHTICGITAAVILLPVSSLLAQRTGTSHPETLNDDVVVTSPAPQASQHYVKPSPAIPLNATEPSPAPMQTRSYVPAAETMPPTAPTQTQTTAYVPPPGLMPVATPAPAREEGFTVTDDVNSGVVTEIVWRENEIPEGTLLHARLNTEISTEMTVVGTPFQARLTRPVEYRGHVMLPVGTVIAGRVSDLRGGHRMGGAALIHLQPESITLPDGSIRRMSAQVSDVIHNGNSRVNDEGTIIGNDHVKGTVAALGLTTGSAAVAGAMIGGGVGAAVGAGVGVGVAAVWWLKHDSHETLRDGTELVFSLDRPLMLQNVIQ